MPRPRLPSVPDGIGLLLLAAGLFLPLTLSAQEPPPPSVGVRTLAEDSIRLDGVLDEPAWLAADSIPNLVMIDPTEGATPTGRTAVRVLVTSRHLLLGVVAYDPDPASIVSFSKARDADIFREDYVLVVLDTFRDGRSGYVFGLNPSGARYDALIIDRGEGQRPTWDAVWEAATARGPWGWSLEIRIPISSIAFAKHLDSWGFNVQRRIQRLQETSRWSGLSRDYEITQTSRAGFADRPARLRSRARIDRATRLGRRRRRSRARGGSRVPARSEPRRRATHRPQRRRLPHGEHRLRRDGGRHPTDEPHPLSPLFSREARLLPGGLRHLPVQPRARQ